jgi:uncharacterized membrane protein YphA (DoxX/SURF4 family)
MDDIKNDGLVSRFQVLVLVILRIAIGWHFLYEGVSKILTPNWTSAPYLESSKWILADLFHAAAANPTALRAIDLLNMWGLTLIGLALIVGCLTRLAGLAGILLLALYYVANPPFISTGFGVPVEGHYLIVNKNLVEMAALALLMAFGAGRYWGWDRILTCARQRVLARRACGASDPAEPWVGVDRRDIIKGLSTVPVLGAFAYASFRKHQWERVNAITGATIQVSSSRLKDLKGELPRGQVGETQVSRIILGGNLIGGWSHSRDLIYVPSLFKAYNTEKKVFETLALAEQAGVNTINITHSQLPLINKYKRIYGGQIQTVCQIHPTADDIYSHANKVMDQGGTMLQIQGNCCDWRVREGRIDVLAACLDHVRKQGFQAGLGAHSIQALMACDKAGIVPDFFMKTIHHDNYWSAHPKANRIPYSVDGKRSKNHDEFHDNMFCLFPDETIEFMKSRKAPWMGFKVLAAGAIHPNDGFKYAFESGADFLCVGMFDYQIVDDVNICLDVLGQVQNRPRPWCG